jgi:hypothetical protein
MMKVILASTLGSFKNKKTLKNILLLTITDKANS